MNDGRDIKRDAKSSRAFVPIKYTSDIEHYSTTFSEIPESPDDAAKARKAMIKRLYQYPLSMEQIEVLILREADSWTYEDIAKKFKKSPPWASQKHKQALEIIKFTEELK